ncbi:ABC transporter permease [Microcella frigidaquae]|uniref:Iron(III) transport system permease protein n=1 Tax=Microcella frigidaquae TaxID=424758 RepID=A0A840XHW1_9MICO|nr:ABC transporter permease subunit [Microcella frigidaquae]MBB5617906.1 iron(III) transport system permease protein [Microcella frigidaquae]NHN44380.1 iron ABC transporter permease [Microcella frigidaquae]
MTIAPPLADGVPDARGPLVEPAHPARPTAGRRPPLALLVAASVAAAAAAIPLVYLVVRAAEAGLPTVIATLSRGRVLEYAANSLALAAATTATALVLGTAVAVVLTRVRVPFARAWLLISALPLAVPSYLAGYGWLVLAPGLNGFVPSWLLLTAVTVPYVTLPVAAALRGASGDLEGVARTLGRGPFRAFLVATWPTVRPAAIAGSLLVALYALSDFGLVAMMRYPTLTWGINAAYSASFDRAQAATLALLLVVLALVVVAGERTARRQVPRAAARAVAPRAVGRGMLVSLLPVVAAAPLLGVGVPLLGLLLRLLDAATLRTIDVSRLLEAVGATVGVAAAAAALALVLALPIAALAARYRGRLVTAIESVGYLGHALPGIVVGLSLVFFALAVVPALYQSLVVLVFAYAVLFMPKAIGTVRAGLGDVPPRLVSVARTLGLSPLQAWWRVTVPLALPSLGVGALLVAIATMKELPATLLLRPTGVQTLATELWNRTVVFEFGAAAPYAALLVLIAAVPAMVLSGVRSAAKEEL